MNIILHDTDAVRTNLLPLTFTRPVGALRCGILTIAEKWEKLLNATIFYATEEYLGELFPSTTDPHAVHIAANILPSSGMAAAVAAMRPGEMLMLDNEPAAWIDSADGSAPRSR